MKILLSTLLVLLFSAVYAQDYIVLRNGEEIVAKVKEINISDVKYMKFDNPTGPIYTINKSEVFLIKYENGTRDIINAVEKNTNATVAPKQSKPEPVGKQKEVKIRATINKDYLQNTEYRKKRGSGIALTTVGSVFSVSGLATVVLGSVIASDIEIKPQVYGMWVACASAGAAALAGGIAMITVGSLQIKKAKAIKRSYQEGKASLDIQPGLTGARAVLTF